MSDSIGDDNSIKVGAEQEQSETEQKNDKTEGKEKSSISMKSMSDWATQFEDVGFFFNLMQCFVNRKL